MPLTRSKPKFAVLDADRVSITFGPATVTVSVGLIQSILDGHRPPGFLEIQLAAALHEAGIATIARTPPATIKAAIQAADIYWGN